MHSFYVALTILDRVLHARSSTTPEALAQELSDSMTPRVVRSVRRYLKRLRALGFRFEQSPGVCGIKVPQAFREQLHLLNFTVDELTALYFHLALASDLFQGSGPHAHLATVCQKIGLGVGELYSLEALQHAFLPFQKWSKTYSTPAVQTTLARLVYAFRDIKVCRMTYRTPQAKRDVTYCLHPYVLSEYEGGLYLFAYLPDRDRIMVLSVERIRAIKVLEKSSFEHSPTIRQQIEARRERTFGIIDDDEELAVTLKFTAEQAPYVRERVWHPSQQVQDDADGSLLLRFQASGWFEIMRWILGWGEHVEVIEPPDLRQAIAQHLETAAQQYAH